MPRQRLPWFKVWVGATRHEKVVTLDDKSFRAWVELLDAASVQPIRGRFTSCAAAAAIIRRPVAVVRGLAAAQLLDEREDGVWLHDWRDWQRWRPEDEHANGSDTAPENHTNNTRKTQQSLQNGSGTANIEHANTRALARAREDVDVEEEIDVEEDVVPPVPSGHPPKRGRRRVTTVDESFRDELEERFWEAFGSREAIRDVMDNAMSDKALLRKTDQRAYLRNWVRGDAERAAARRGKYHLAVVGTAAVEDVPAAPIEQGQCPGCGRMMVMSNLREFGMCRSCKRATQSA